LRTITAVDTADRDGETIIQLTIAQACELQRRVTRDRVTRRLSLKIGLLDRRRDDGCLAILVWKIESYSESLKLFKGSLLLGRLWFFSVHR